MKYQVIIKKVLGFGTTTFKFKSLQKAKNYAEKNANRLVDILEVENNNFISLMF